MGGLGNQLFQIFTTIAYAIEYNLNAKFLDVDYLGGDGCTKRITYWNSFLKPFKNNLFLKMPDNMIEIKEQNFQYNKLPPPPPDAENIVIAGYFQSPKYFEKFNHTLFSLIELEKHQQDSKYAEYRDKEGGYISIHFRLGDYKNLSWFHPILKDDYYQKALFHIIDVTKKSNHNILYFCEDSDINEVNDSISNLKLMFPECIFEKIPSVLADWEQLIAMSCCDHNIIANSSFSWFGAYFNCNKNKVVCYPEMWFCGDGANNIKNDLFPNEWTKI
jgi:hypothetical protein